MDKKHELINEHFNNNKTKHEDACNLTQSDINQIECKKCNCEYKKKSYKLVTWFFLGVLTLLIALILTIVLIDILYH